jgi:hypothetical protein
VEGGFCNRQAFACPGAKRIRGWQAPSMGDEHFSTRSGSTLSYSYISMVADDANPSWNHANRMTLLHLEPTLVVLADQNPRCTPGYSTLVPYDASFGQKKMNSLNHDRRGQNAARLDGSVLWLTDANDSSENDIYSSESPYEPDGKRGGTEPSEDPFLIP